MPSKVFHIDTRHSVLDQAAHAKTEAQERYVRWMVQYELPQLTALMDRIEEVSESYGDASVGIYVKKDAVSAVVRSNERAMPEVRDPLSIGSSCPDQSEPWLFRTHAEPRQHPATSAEAFLERHRS